PSTLTLYLQLYESLAVYGAFLEKARADTKNPNIHQNGSYVQELMRNNQIPGPFGLISLDAYNQRLAPFKVFLVDTGQNDMVNFIAINVSTECSSGNEEVNGRCLSMEGKWSNEDPNFADTLPPDVPSCGFTGELCDQRGTIIIVVSIMGAVCAGFIIFLCVRRMRSGETSQMPWAIASQSINFIDFDYHGYNGSSNMSIHSLQQQMESKAAMSDLLRSRQLATIEQGFVIVEPYKLKEKIAFDKRDMQLLFQASIEGC
ncbi:RGC/RGC protein kinase, partial [Aphelenchoides avenae]